MADKKDQEKNWLEKAEELGNSALNAAANTAKTVAGAATVVADSVITTTSNVVNGQDKMSLSETLEKYGVKGKEQADLIGELSLRPKVNAIIEQNLDKPESQERERLAKSIIEKWRSDKNILGKLNSDLMQSRYNEEVSRLADRDPGKLAGMVHDYNGTNMSTLLERNSSSGPVASGEVSNPGQNPQLSQQHPLQPQARQSAPASTHATSNPVSKEDKQLFRDSFATWANKDPKDIAQAIDGEMTVKILTGVAEQAVEKYKVDKKTADNFIHRINSDKQLRNDITQNFKRHPEFIQLLAKKAGETGIDRSENANSIKEALEGAMKDPSSYAKDEVVVNAVKIANDPSYGRRMAIEGVINSPNEKISEMFNEKYSKMLAVSIKEYVHDNYNSDSARDTQLNAKAEAFETAIKTNPALQKRIAERVKEDPQFLKEMLRAIKDDPDMDPEQKAKIKEATTPILEEILDNPEGLGKKDFLKRIKSDMGDVKKDMMFSGISNMLGIDLKGIMGSIGSIFKEFIQKIGDFFRGWGKGGIVSMASNQNLGFGERVNKIFADVERDPHSHWEKDVMKAVPDKSGQLFHKETRTNPKGEQVEVEKANTISVGASGGTVQIIPTGGATLLRLEDDHYKVRVASEIDKNGNATGVKDVYLTEKGYNDFNRTVEERGGRPIIISPLAQKQLDGQNVLQESGPQITVRVDPVSGATVQTFPVRGQDQIPEQELQKLTTPGILPTNG